MAKSVVQRKAEAAWARIEALGGHGVWDGDIVFASLAGTSVTDADLALFRDFPFVQNLDLSHTGIGDDGLAHLVDLPALTELIVVDTNIGRATLKAFMKSHPVVTVVTKARPQGDINPFTGKPM